jgi:hypothetical protein
MKSSLLVYLGLFASTNALAMPDKLALRQCTPPFQAYQNGF